MTEEDKKKLNKARYEVRKWGKAIDEAYEEGVPNTAPRMNALFENWNKAKEKVKTIKASSTGHLKDF